MLLQLRRETRRAEQEETLATAARLLGLLEREGAEAGERLRRDRARHEEVARRRLAAHRLDKAQEASGVCFMTQLDAGIQSVIAIAQHRGTRNEG